MYIGYQNNFVTEKIFSNIQNVLLILTLWFVLFHRYFLNVQYTCISSCKYWNLFNKYVKYVSYNSFWRKSPLSNFLLLSLVCRDIFYQNRRLAIRNVSFFFISCAKKASGKNSFWQNDSFLKVAKTFFYLYPTL